MAGVPGVSPLVSQLYDSFESHLLMLFVNDRLPKSTKGYRAGRTGAMGNGGCERGFEQCIGPGSTGRSSKMMQERVVPVADKLLQTTEF